MPHENFFSETNSVPPFSACTLNLWAPGLNSLRSSSATVAANAALNAEGSVTSNERVRSSFLHEVFALGVSCDAALYASRFLNWTLNSGFSPAAKSSLPPIATSSNR
ncbi:Uncharacterised protein [Candidatus Norongarragalina meridionalis]|nr:Uncharacterised protein [Candidatus Norongarragalina meridionalis]